MLQGTNLYSIPNDALKKITESSFERTSNNWIEVRHNTSCQIKSKISLVKFIVYCTRSHVITRWSFFANNIHRMLTGS